MNDLIKRIEELQDKLHDNLHEYPLFQEILDDIYDKKIPEIEKLLYKNEEFYYKEAINKLIKSLLKSSLALESKTTPLTKFWPSIPIYKRPPLEFKKPQISCFIFSLISKVKGK